MRDCPTNKQGIYINGGACKICKGTDHLAMNCPSKDKCLRCGEKGHVSSDCPKENSGRYVPPKKVRKGQGAAPGDVRTGGDDLEDDFEEEVGKAVKWGGKGGGEDDDEDVDDDDDTPDAKYLEWEKSEDGGAVLKDHGSGKKKKRKEDGKDKAKDKTKAKKAKIVEF